MVYHIAAGEVIDSPTAVVRELVENALDAQATHLTIGLWPEAGRVRVVDNGLGMTQANLILAASPHSTSKILTQQDLWQVQSLGFRGEALHSLAQVGQLTICSRPQGDGAGWQVTYSSQGQPQAAAPIAMAPGTVVTVADLFAQWPDRRQRLPSQARQLKDFQQLIHHFALAHPQVTWVVQVNHRPWLCLTPSPTARGLIPQMLKTLADTDLREGYQTLDQEVENSAPARLYGLIGLPDRCHRPRPDWVKVAVNGRLVALPELEQAILGAFRYTLPRHRYPLCFLHLAVAPHHIDWHRSPDKSRLYLHQLDQWVDQCQQQITALLGQNTATLPEPSHQQKMTQLVAAESGGQYLAPIASPINLSDPWPRERPDLALRAIAQVHNRYILAEQPDGLCLIEQHIAHERVLYERLQARWQLVPLNPPVVLEHLSAAQIEQLQRLGLPPEEFGPHRWAVRQAPAPLVVREDLPDALIELSLGGNLDTAQVAVACRTAIRNGTPLSLATMQTLLDDWQQTQNPRTCPHGRPICLTLKESSLARFFRRNWVVGKSHGL